MEYDKHQRLSHTGGGVHRSAGAGVYPDGWLHLCRSGDGTGISPANFYLESGDISPSEIVASTKKGLLLTRTLGHGLNPVTGDISRGAFGLWIEDGAVVHPVSEITVSGNLGRILREIEAVGKDLEFWSPLAGPTIKVAEMTVAGE